MSVSVTMDGPKVKRARIRSQKVSQSQGSQASEGAETQPAKPKDQKLKAKDPKKTKQKSSSASKQPHREQHPAKGTSSLKAKADALYGSRKKLPIFSHADGIRQELTRNDVMLLIGETGSGKSTQIPQFLVDEDWCKPVKTTLPIPATVSEPHGGEREANGENEPAKKKNKKKNKNKTQQLARTRECEVGGCIAITQPRRVAAISLARRVADEMGTPLGSSSPASRVGYSVRFDTSVSPCTRVKFLTEGMLLQEMLHDPWLTKYSAVVVDEVHERGVNVDVILGFLRNMVFGNLEGRGGIPIKVVVMSATADMASLHEFFTAGLLSRKPREATETKTSPNNELGPAQTSTEDPTKDVAVCHIEGRRYPVKVIYSSQPVPDFVDAALKTIFQIHMKEPLPGDILVFLTGQETVEALEQLVNEFAGAMDPTLPKIQVLPLFAALPQATQQRVFFPAPPRTRKVILSTNIAETSVTVSGVRHVVDCGKAKMKQFRSRLGLDSLLVKPISKSAAIQRKGRAGREAPGTCYRLYTEGDYLALQDTNTPEILRCDLSQAILTMKARGIDDVLNFPFLTRPSREALEKALLQLFSLGALNETGGISDIGTQIARLPLNAPLGRVLLAGATYGPSVLLDVIDIISCLTVESIFLSTFSEDKREEAESARRDIYRREGDHLTLLLTVRGYAGENVDRKQWAEKHLVSHRAMQSVMDVRKQLLAQSRQAKLLPESALESSTSAVSQIDVVAILKSFLAGFATNTAKLQPDGSYRTVVGHQSVAIHPSSVLFGRKVESVMYNEFVFTNRSYARGVSAVQMDWVAEALGAVV